MRKKICFIALLAIASCKPLPDVGDEVEYNIIDVDYNEHSYVVFDNFRGGLCGATFARLQVFNKRITKPWL